MGLLKTLLSTKQVRMLSLIKYESYSVENFIIYILNAPPTQNFLNKFDKIIVGKLLINPS